MHGFKITPLADGRNILHILGAISREKEGNNNSLRIDVDLNSTKDEIMLLDYTWKGL